MFSGFDGLAVQRQRVENLAMESEKVCPFCAETIKAEAVKCRYCQSDVSGGLEQGPTVDGSRRWLLGAVVLFALAGFMLIYTFVFKDLSGTMPDQCYAGDLDVSTYAAICHEAFPTENVVWAVVEILAGLVVLGVWIVAKGNQASRKA